MKKILEFKKIITFIFLGLFYVISVIVFLNNNHYDDDFNSHLFYIFSYCALFILVVWEIFIIIRVSDRKARNIILIIFFTSFFWMLLKNVRYLFADSYYERYLVYLYFIPMLYITILFLYLCQTIFMPKSKVPKRILLILFIVSSLLLTFALFNDKHELFLGLEKIKGTNMFPLKIGFYLILGYDLLILFTSLITFFIGTYRRNSLHTSISVFIPIIMLIGYTYLYIAMSSEILVNLMPTFYIFSLILLIEIYIQLGLIQNNGQYYKFFYNCHLPLEIKDKDNNVLYTSKSYFYKQDTEYHYITKELRGGIITMREDFSKINLLQNKLIEHKTELTINNEILSKSKILKEEEERLYAKTQILNVIEKTIESKSKMIEDLVNSLPDEITAENKDEVYKKLQKIRLNICYLKQKCMLVLLTKDQRFISNKELKIIMDVIKNDVQNVGFNKVLIALVGNEDVSIRFALAINELLNLIGRLFCYNDLDVFVSVNTKTIRCVVEIETPLDIDCIFEDDSFKNLGFSYSFNKNENNYNIVIKEEK